MKSGIVFVDYTIRISADMKVKISLHNVLLEEEWHKSIIPKICTLTQCSQSSKLIAICDAEINAKSDLKLTVFWEQFILQR